MSEALAVALLIATIVFAIWLFYLSLSVHALRRDLELQSRLARDRADSLEKKQQEERKRVSHLFKYLNIELRTVPERTVIQQLKID